MVLKYFPGLWGTGISDAIFCLEIDIKIIKGWGGGGGGGGGGGVFIIFKNYYFCFMFSFFSQFLDRPSKKLTFLLIY